MVCDEPITKEKILGSSETLSIFFKFIIQDIPPSGPAMQLFTVGSSNKHDITCESHLDHHHHHDTDTTLAINKHLLQPQFHHYTLPVI